MKQESAESKSKPRLREANRFNFSSNRSKALNIINGEFSFLKFKESSKFSNNFVSLSQVSLQKLILVGLELRHFHV